MKNLFKPEEFAKINGTTIHEDHCLYVNNKLNALIKQAPVVYASPFIGMKPRTWYSDKQTEGIDSFKGIVMFVEEIVKEPCKHQPPITRSAEGWMIQNYCCKHCGVELIADWKAK